MPHQFSGDFSVRRIDDLTKDNDLVQELHRHDFYLVLALESAAGQHEIDFIPYTITNNSIFIMRPGQVHRLHLNKESKGCLIQFRSSFFQPPPDRSDLLLRRAGKHTRYKLSPAEFQRLIPALTAVADEFNQKQEQYQEMIHYHLGIFFIELLRHSGSTETGENAGAYHQERLETFLGLVRTHYNRKQPSDYAKMLNISLYQLNSATRTTLDKTCSEVINQEVILEAKRFLLATSSQINQIAYHLGYEDVSYFIRFFKKHTGYSPDAFRQNFS